MRDTQRSRVYKSDAALDAFSQRYDSMDDLQRFVRKVWSQKRVQEMVPEWRRGVPIVKDGRGRRRACGNNWGITMPLWSRRTGTIIHELAHVIESRQPKKLEVAPHGWEYCAIYLKLTLYVMGREAHDALKAAFKANRVRFTPPRKRAPLSPEQREMLGARLAAARVLAYQKRMFPV